MKALILKDLYSLKESRILLLLMAAIAVIMGFRGGEEGIGFIQSYVSAISAILVINVIGYDEVDNGYVFLFTLPVSRKQYVAEKYLFGWSTGILGWGFATVLSEIVAPSGISDPDSLRWPSYGAVLTILLIIQALVIPIQLKFGGQKGKLAVIVAIAIACGGAALGAKLLGKSIEQGIALSIEMLSEFTTVQLLGMELATALIAGGISLLCSIRIMETKAF